MIELAAEQGFEKVTVRGLSRLAGVSTATFYKQFPNVEECFASTYESLMQRALRRAYTAQRETDDREEGVRAALLSLSEDFANHPKEARLALVEAYAAGPAMHSRITHGASTLGLILGDDLVVDATARPHLARGIAAGVTRVMRTRLLAGQGSELRKSAAALGDWVISISSDARRRVQISEPKPPARSRRRPRRADDELYAPALGKPGDERGRILSAVAKLSLSDGDAGLSISQICARAGVSRRAFKTQFADVREAFLETIETTVTETVARAEAAADRADDMESGIERAMQTLCVDAVRNPDLARLCFVDIFLSGREGLLRRERWVSVAAERLQVLPAGGKAPAALDAEASLAAAWQVAYAEIAAGRASELARLVPVLTHLLLAPTPAARPAPALSQA